MNKNLIFTLGLLSCPLTHAMSFFNAQPGSDASSNTPVPQEVRINIENLEQLQPKAQRMHLGAVRADRMHVDHLAVNPRISCTCCLRSASLVSFIKACVSLGQSSPLSSCCLPLGCAACLVSLSAVSEIGDNWDRIEESLRSVPKKICEATKAITDACTAVAKKLDKPEELHKLAKRYATTFNRERIEELEQLWGHQHQS